LTCRELEIIQLKNQEKFIVKGTGAYECGTCGYLYDQHPPSTNQELPGMRAWDNLPSTYLCPKCQSPKSGFVEQTITIAGFEVNQGYGLGTNSMTGGQKNLLIFGGLAAFFLLFLLGYALD
ncbi:unnamed protein product, partial [Chrysoparadoxa australica]